jgi:hypothetical protein
MSYNYQNVQLQDNEFNNYIENLLNEPLFTLQENEFDNYMDNLQTQPLFQNLEPEGMLLNNIFQESEDLDYIQPGQMSILQPLTPQVVDPNNYTQTDEMSVIHTQDTELMETQEEPNEFLKLFCSDNISLSINNIITDCLDEGMDWSQYLQAEDLNNGDYLTLTNLKPDSWDNVQTLEKNRNYNLLFFLKILINNYLLFYRFLSTLTPTTETNQFKRTTIF